MRRLVAVVVLAIGTAVALTAQALIFAPEPVRPRLVPRPLDVAVVDRLRWFDADGSGELTARELPPRLQPLIARGDADGDGRLGLDELVTLTGAAARDPLARRVLPPLPVRGPVRPPLPAGLDGIISDLKLPPSRHEEAMAVIRAAQDTPAARVDPATMLPGLKRVLRGEEYDAVAKAIRRGGGIVRGVVGAPPPPPPPPPPPAPPPAQLPHPGGHAQDDDGRAPDPRQPGLH